MATITFFKIPIHFEDESNSHHLFDILLPSILNESIILEIIQFIIRLRCGISQASVISGMKNIDNFLALFFNAQPYNCFNYIYLKVSIENDRYVSNKSMIRIGDMLFDISSTNDQSFVTQLCMCLMKYYISP